jgi:hypothetical protein
MMLRRVILGVFALVLLAGCGADCSYPAGQYNPACHPYGAAGFNPVNPGFQNQPGFPASGFPTAGFPATGFPVAGNPINQPFGPFPQQPFFAGGGYWGAPCSPMNPYCYH